MRKALFWIILLIVAVLGFTYLSQPNISKQQISTIAISQKIANGQPAKIQIEGGKTALDLLRKTTQVEMQGEGENAFVTSINGRLADQSKKEFWAFYVNGKPAQVGAGSYILKAEDKIEWKLETY